MRPGAGTMLPGDLDDAARTARAPRLLGFVWALLVIDTLGSQGAATIVSIPREVTQSVTMGSVILAFALALMLNPRLEIRPNAFLVLLSLLAVISVASSLRLESGYGALFRCGRLVLFVATLWLMTKWWDGGLRFARYHVRALSGVLLSVAIGLVVAPGLARPDEYGGRLVGVLWPLTAPQVGQYAAIVVGLTLVLWLGKRTDWRTVLVLGAPALALLFLSHTRTAMFGLVAGLAVAMLSLLLTSTRARRAFCVVLVGVGVVAVAFASAVEMWVLRGQDADNFGNLTGREKVWDMLLGADRTVMEQVFGVGLTNKSFNGLPIDGSWLAVYHEQGVAGVVLVIAFMLVLVVSTALRPPSPSRAAALFLLVYCLAASYTEVGLGDASPYLLHLAVAAALVAPRNGTGAPSESLSEPPEEVRR